MSDYEWRMAMTRKKRCEHKTAVYEWQQNAVGPIAKRCSVTFGCGALLSLGPANDLDLDVQHEIAAAEIVARLKTGGPHLMTNAERDGFHDIDGSDFAGLAAWHIGWLAAEATYDHSDGWAWDVSRSIAEQLAETARVDGAADRLLNDLAADAAGRSVVPEQLADELCDSAEDECDHRGTWSPDASVSECPKCLKTWRTEDILPDEVAS